MTNFSSIGNMIYRIPAQFLVEQGAVAYNLYKMQELRYRHGIKIWDLSYLFSTRKVIDIELERLSIGCFVSITCAAATNSEVIRAVSHIASKLNILSPSSPAWSYCRYAVGLIGIAGALVNLYYSHVLDATIRNDFRKLAFTTTICSPICLYAISCVAKRVIGK